MRKLLITITLIAACLYVGGCAGTSAATPEDEWFAARHTLTGVERVIGIGYQAGVIDDEAVTGADPYVQAARATLDHAETLLPEGGTEFELLMTYLDSLMRELQPLATEVSIE